MFRCPRDARFKHMPNAEAQNPLQTVHTSIINHASLRFHRREGALKSVHSVRSSSLWRSLRATFSYYLHERGLVLDDWFMVSLAPCQLLYSRSS